jgi:hypothetical protein
MVAGLFAKSGSIEFHCFSHRADGFLFHRLAPSIIVPRVDRHLFSIYSYEGARSQLNAYSNIEDSRLKLIVSDLIKHLHTYVKETKVTDEEWEFAWDFMKRMAEITGPERNEFILMADVMGVSQLIETLNHEEPNQPVGFALVGPFYRANAPFRERGAFIASDVRRAHAFTSPGRYWILRVLPRSRMRLSIYGKRR